MNDFEGYPTHLMPLEEKIHVFFKDEVAFTVADIERKFPEENRRSIYRAVVKLAETNRIRYLRYVDRKKVYTAIGQSNLPMIKTNQGKIVPVAALINAMPDLYDANGRFKQTELDDVFVVMCQLFVIAQDPTRADFMAAHKRLLEIREFFLRMVDNVDAVLRHPAMSGDLELFKRTFNSGNDPAIPDAKALMEFRRWLANK